MKNHKFHIVYPSPWPFLTSLSLGTMATGALMWFHNKTPLLLMGSTICLTLCITQWWRDIIRESTFQGHHTKKIQSMITGGSILFIVSELMFFFGIFWALYHLSAFPSPFTGNWPPKGISLFNPGGLPLLNTTILLSSGFFLSWSHYAFNQPNFKMSQLSLILTIILGAVFSVIQIFEYSSAEFTMSDSSYGTMFFFSTGFHGIHVIVGTTSLIVTWLRMRASHFSKNHKCFFDFAVWYWHFVDMVWILLFVFLYFLPW